MNLLMFFVIAVSVGILALFVFTVAVVRIDMLIEHNRQRARARMGVVQRKIFTLRRG